MRLHSACSLSAVLLSATFFALPASAAPWDSGAPLPMARSQSASAVDPSGGIHLIGGFDDTDTETATHDVLLADGGWTSGAPLPFPGRGAAAGVGADGTIYYVGGLSIGSDAGTGAGSLYAYLGVDAGWNHLSEMPLPAGWETSADVGADGKLYVFGGEAEETDDAGNNHGANSRVAIFDPGAGNWTYGASMPVRLKEHRVLRGSDGNFYVIGGQDENGGTAFNTVFVYHPTTNTWTNGPSIPSIALDDAGADAGALGINSFAATTSPDRAVLIVAGGSTNYGNDGSPFFDTVFLFDVAAQTWTRYTPLLPVGRRDVMAGAVSCRLSVLGGSNGSPITENDTVLMDALCGGSALGTKCIDDATPHCGCATSADCKLPGATCTASHVCEGGDAGTGPGDGGANDGGSKDGGSLGRDGGGPSSDSGAGGDAGGGGGDGSSGCGCALVGADDSGPFAAVGVLGALFALTARGRSRRKSKRS